MESYLLMARWVRTIAGCYAWRALVLATPGIGEVGELARVDAWIDETLERIRDQGTEL